MVLPGIDSALDIAPASVRSDVRAAVGREADPGRDVTAVANARSPCASTLLESVTVMPDEVLKDVVLGGVAPPLGLGSSAMPYKLGAAPEGGIVDIVADDAGRVLTVLSAATGTADGDELLPVVGARE